jgi:hypothetical protein
MLVLTQLVCGRPNSAHFNANCLLTDRERLGERGVDYCVGLRRTDVRAHRKIMFDLCASTLCDFSLEHKYGINGRMPVHKFIAHGT